MPLNNIIKVGNIYLDFNDINKLELYNIFEVIEYIQYDSFKYIHIENNDKRIEYVRSSFSAGSTKHALSFLVFPWNMFKYIKANKYKVGSLFPTNGKYMFLNEVVETRENNTKGIVKYLANFSNGKIQIFPIPYIFDKFSFHHLNFLFIPWNIMSTKLNVKVIKKNGITTATFDRNKLLEIPISTLMKEVAEDTRNVIDHYKYWHTDAIIADLDEKRHNFSVLCSNLYNDFNIATVIRNANAFLAKEVIIYGRRRYDKRGTVGTDKYSHFKHIKTIEDLSFPENVNIVGIDNIQGAKDINVFSWDKNKHTILCFGQEDVGLPKEVLNICQDIVYIPQYGSVRSLNVGSASAIVMSDYCRKTYGA